MLLVQISHCHLFSEAGMEIMTGSLRKQCLFISVALGFPLQLLLGLHFQLQDVSTRLSETSNSEELVQLLIVSSRGVVPAGCFSSLGSLSVKHVILFRIIFLIKCLLEP